MEISAVNAHPSVFELSEKNRDKKDIKSVDFFDVFNEALKKVDSLQKEVDALTLQYLAGGIDSIHEVVIAAERANLTLQLAVQIRNKVIEAYQEISRMQI
ncbi:MAG: flagellar hook-basal body complex protein FliE [Clostridia bacterium]|nr:flagellar hook-basal body complex protein FliE [Clostridia bacterium]